MNPHRKIVVTVILCVIGMVIAGVAVGQQRTRPQPPRPEDRTAWEDLQVTSDQWARIQVDAFELICTPARLITLDLDELTADVTEPNELLTNLGRLGSARTLFRVDEQFALGEAVTLRSRSRVPIQDVAMTEDGRRTTTTQYHYVGYNLDFRAFWDEQNPNMVMGRWDIEVTGVLPTGPELEPGVRMPVFQQTNMTKRFLAENGMPVYSMASNIPVAVPQGVEAQVVIVRMVMSR
jgi:hypothetical protein